MQDSRIVACNLLKINLLLGICQVLRAQITEHLFSQYTPQEPILSNKVLKSYLYKLNNFIVPNCYDLLKNIGAVKVKI